MLLNRRWEKSIRLGSIVEDIFEIVATQNGYSVKRANEYANRKWRIDFILNKEGEKPKLVDVKARRKKKRFTKEYAWVVEIYNKSGVYVFSKPFTHYAFELSPAEFLIIHKKHVEEYIRGLATKWNAEVLDEPIYYNYYRRGKDIVFIAPEKELSNLYKFGEIIYIPAVSDKVSRLVSMELEIRREY